MDDGPSSCQDGGEGGGKEWWALQGQREGCRQQGAAAVATVYVDGELWLHELPAVEALGAARTVGREEMAKEDRTTRDASHRAAASGSFPVSASAAAARCLRTPACISCTWAQGRCGSDLLALALSAAPLRTPPISCAWALPILVLPLIY